MEHATYIGTRGVRCADSANRPMHFARCACGWEGPSRIKRTAAAHDGQLHLTSPDPVAAGRMGEPNGSPRNGQ
jgi:hypothetical protein